MPWPEVEEGLTAGEEQMHEGAEAEGPGAVSVAPIVGSASFCRAGTLSAAVEAEVPPARSGARARKWQRKSPGTVAGNADGEGGNAGGKGGCFRRAGGTGRTRQQ